MHPDPTAPIDFMEEPVHHDQENDNCKQAGPSLQIESRNILRKIADDPYCNEPRGDCGEKTDAGSDCNRAAMHPIIAIQTGSDCREHQNGFQSLSENQNSDIEDRDRLIPVSLGRIGGTMGSDSLPDENGDDK